MADVYKLLADIICASIDTEWEKVEVKIESSPKKCYQQTPVIIWQMVIKKLLSF